MRNMLFRNIYSSYQNFFPALYYFVIVISFVVRYFFPQVDYCGSFLCFGPVTNLLIILLSPSIFFLLFIGGVDWLNTASSLFEIIFFWGVVFLLTLPQAVFLAFFGRLLDQGKKKLAGLSALLIVVFVIFLFFTSR